MKRIAYLFNSFNFKLQTYSSLTPLTNICSLPSSRINPRAFFKNLDFSNELISTGAELVIRNDTMFTFSYSFLILGTFGMVMLLILFYRHFLLESHQKKLYRENWD
ncbi:hypothetical protein CDIK_0570 [Cucumispora dikerogammari]|nr:hypothetical protein CDIK_0570 [Cucumispora dikerogammari]